MPVDGEPDLRGIPIFLAVILPPADRTKLHRIGGLQRFAPAAWAAIQTITLVHVEIDGNRNGADYLKSDPGSSECVERIKPIRASEAWLQRRIGTEEFRGMRRFHSLIDMPLCCGIVMGMILLWPAMMSAQSSPNRLRVAIAGLVHDHVSGFLAQLSQHPDVELVGIAEPDSALQAKYQAKYHLADGLFFEDVTKMIEQRHPQALLVYTSIADHRRMIEVGASYGVSVMVEKPLTISLDDALAIRRIARDKHIHVLVNYETTWYASNKAAYDEVMTNEIGPVRRVVVQDGHQGPKEIGVSPEFFKWLTDPEQNGAGALYDFGCYGVDLMTWLMHGEAPETVTAVVNHDKPEIYPRVDDDSTIVLQYPHAQAVIQGSWNWPFSRKDMEVYGSTGYAITVGSDKMRVRHENDREEQWPALKPLPPDESNSLSYLAGVLRGQILDHGDLSALDTNVTVMQILDRARESARSGRTVHLTAIGD
jgi:glucose-fructose oxidoreductase